MEDEPIYFYAKFDPFYEFSNFAPHGLTVDGVYWPTAEHYFQAQKFHDAAYRERIRQARTPKEAKALGQSRKMPLRADWEAVKEEVMLVALRGKFVHRKLKRLLLDTGRRPLIEHAPSDYYWGCGKDGSGKNRLGTLLMQVRAELQEESP